MINWNPALKTPARSLETKLSEPDIAAFTQQVQKDALDRLMTLMEGLEVFTKSSAPTVGISPRRALWNQGSTSLFDYAPESTGMPLLLVPSLINRSYILDLTPHTSLISYLKEQGFHPYLMDWGEPSNAEKDFSLEDYISRIDNAIRHIKQPFVMAGYCMGGLMALAAAIKHQKKLKGLALLATPWDFHSEDTERSVSSGKDIERLTALFEKVDFVPKEMIYLMFYFLNPWSVHHKYISGMMNDEARRAREYWLHDGMAMARKVAQECFIDWAYHNTPGLGKWRVNGQTVKPQDISLPTFIASPAYDRVVPPLCSRPLSTLIPHAATITCPSGHVGMVVGEKRQQHLWEPLANWLRGL